MISSSTLILSSFIFPISSLFFSVRLFVAVYRFLFCSNFLSSVDPLNNHLYQYLPRTICILYIGILCVLLLCFISVKRRLLGQQDWIEAYLVGWHGEV